MGVVVWKMLWLALLKLKAQGGKTWKKLAREKGVAILEAQKKLVLTKRSREEKEGNNKRNAKVRKIDGELGVQSELAMLES